MHPLRRPGPRTRHLRPGLLSMPAIDPHRLARQLDNLRTQSSDPDQIARDVGELIEEYSDPTRSRAAAVPAPVIRSLRATLHQLGQQRAISEALWKCGLPDARLLAAGLLERVEDAEVAATAERWAGQNVPIGIVRELGERGLSGWRRADPIGFLVHITSWLDNRRRRSRVLAVYALRGRVRDADFEDLPSAFGLVEGRLAGTRGEMREALVVLITSLAEVAPEETAGFLDDEESSPLTRALRARFNTQRVRVV